MHDLNVELDVLRRQLSRVRELLAAPERAQAEGRPGGLVGNLEPLPQFERWGVPVVRKPVSGQVLAPGLRFFAGKHQGWIQILQKPSTAPAETFALALDFTAFDGNWMSLVLDSRALAAGVPAGMARILVFADVETCPPQNVLFKCAWRHAGQEGQSRQGVPQPAGRIAAELELGWVRPQDLESLEFHVIFPMSGRGSVLIQALRMVWLVSPEGGDKAGAGSDVFEEAP